MRQKTMLKKCGMLLVILVLALAIGSTAVFADEENPSEGTISVQITVGENGSVNGHTESYSESIAGGSNLILNCAADDGFVISRIYVNDAELDTDDLDGIASKSTGNLTLESLTQNVTVAVQFSAEGAGDQEEPVVTDNDDNTQGDDVAGTVGEGSVAEDDEDSDNGEETPADSAEDAEDSDGDQDSEDTWNLEGSEDDENLGEADLFPDEDPDGTDDIPEDGAADTDAEAGEKAGTDNTATEDGSDSVGAEDGEDSAGSDQTTADQSGTETKETASTDAGQNAASGSTDGKGSTEDASDDSYMDGNPKTGDSFPAQIVLIMLTSLCAMAGLIVSHLLRRRGLE